MTNNIVKNYLFITFKFTKFLLGIYIKLGLESIYSYSKFLLLRE